MLKYKAIIFSILTIIALAACASNSEKPAKSKSLGVVEKSSDSLPDGAEKIILSSSGGYTRNKIDNNQYIIAFYSDQKYNSAITASDYTLLGAAETAISNNKKYFKIITLNSNRTKMQILLTNNSQEKGRLFIAKEVQTGIRSRKSHNFK